MTFAYFSFTYYHACEIIVTCHKLIENKVNFNFVSLMNFEKKKNAVYVRVRACMCMRAYAPSRVCGCACAYMHAWVWVFPLSACLPNTGVYLGQCVSVPA